MIKESKIKYKGIGRGQGTKSIKMVRLTFVFPSKIKGFQTFSVCPLTVPFCPRPLFFMGSKNPHKSRGYELCEGLSPLLVTNICSRVFGLFFVPCLPPTFCVLFLFSIKSIKFLFLCFTMVKFVLLSEFTDNKNFNT